MKELLEKNGITLYSTENDEKSSVCERWNRTYIHTYTLFMLEIYRVAVELIYSRK